ncbi:hypothetical protein OG539_41960 [Actinacidiphila glaucinigra]|nr:hypothetical protein [Actinacidiphila glaucinigra]WSD57698.1 hypothetical protein OIE69_01520 [Actinacidiphila glaucinigra]
MPLIDRDHPLITGLGDAPDPVAAAVLRDAVAPNRWSCASSASTAHRW